MRVNNNNNNNNNNDDDDDDDDDDKKKKKKRLFMAPHLVRAQSTYKDIRIHSFHLTLTRTQRVGDS